MLGANSEGIPSSITITVGDPISVLWSPTTRDFNPIENDRGDRSHHDTFFVGFKDWMTFEMGNTPMIWRRVVFWSYARSLFAQTILDGSGNYYRRTSPFTYSNQAGFFNEVILGTEGIDWEQAHMYKAQLDPRRIRVISDRRQTINPRNGTGFLKTPSPYHSIRRKVMYDDKELGGDTQSSIWSIVAPNAPGNLYVWDTFVLPTTYGTNPVSVRYETRVYWRES